MGDREITLQPLLDKLDELITLHRRNGDVWVDFFEGSRERILKDPVFGCDYLIMAWHGIGGYDDKKIFEREDDELLRRKIHPELYKMASEIKK